MCNNCQYNGIHVSLHRLPNKAAKIQQKLDEVKRWYHEQKRINDNLISEKHEMEKQVSALMQALETQNRENQPYIKELEEKRDFYKENYEYMKSMYSPVAAALHKATSLLERAHVNYLPEDLQDEIQLFLSTDKQ